MTDRSIVLSLRRQRPVAWFGGIRDAEVALADALGAEVVDIEQRDWVPDRGPLASPHIRRVLAHTRVAAPYRLRRDHDSGGRADLMAVFASDLFDCAVLLGTPGWEDLADRVVLHLAEVAPHELRTYRDVVVHLQHRVDHLFVGTAYVPHEAFIDGRLRTSALAPPVVDVVSFAGGRPFADRHITFFNPGRRHPDQHRVLGAWAAAHDAHYVFDTAYVGDVHDLAEHRRLFCSTVSRSQFFLTNPARFDQPRQTNRLTQPGTRFFEAMAGGCVLVGSESALPPAFERMIASPGPVEFALDAAAVPTELAGLLGDIASAEALGRRNRAVALRRLDISQWWGGVAGELAIAAPPGLVERRAMLDRMAADLT